MNRALNTFGTLIVLFCLTYLSGCGMKPRPAPPGATVKEAIAAIERHAINAADFSGRALVTTRVRGERNKATVLIRYLKPNRFRIFIKGFAGIEIARLSAVTDSTTLYIPSENMYLVADRGKDLLAQFMPDAKIDFKSIETIFLGTLPPPEERESFRTDLTYEGRRLIVTLERDDLRYVYALEGPELSLVEEEVFQGSRSLWHRTIESYIPCGDKKFPGIMTLERDGAKLTASFTACKMDTGLTEKDLSFKIPSSAERFLIESSR